MCFCTADDGFFRYGEVKPSSFCDHVFVTRLSVGDSKSLEVDSSLLVFGMDAATCYNLQ